MKKRHSSGRIGSIGNASHTSDGCGVEITAAHGGWESEAHDRYERFKLANVLDIPARMIGSMPAVMDGGDSEERPRPQPEVRQIVRSSGVRRGDTSRPAADGDLAAGDDEDEDAEVVMVRRKPPGRPPNGTNGRPMTWDGARGGWRETPSEDEGGEEEDEEDEEEEDGGEFYTAETPPPLPDPTRPAPRSARLAGVELPYGIFAAAPPDRRGRDRGGAASGAQAPAAAPPATPATPRLSPTPDVMERS